MNGCISIVRKNQSRNANLINSKSLNLNSVLSLSYKPLRVFYSNIIIFIIHSISQILFYFTTRKLIILDTLPEYDIFTCHFECSKESFLMRFFANAQNDKRVARYDIKICRSERSEESHTAKTQYDNFKFQHKG